MMAKTTGRTRFWCELNIGTTTRHVGGDGYGAGLTGFGNNLGFTLVLLGVQDLVVDLPQLQHAAQQFGDFNGSGTHQHGSAFAV